MLLNFNSLSKSRYDTTHNDFKKHTILLTEMKKDLDTVFQRIRVLKGKLGKMYPEAFTACGDVYNVLEEEDEDNEDEDGETPTPLSPPGHPLLAGQAHAHSVQDISHQPPPPLRRPTRGVSDPANRRSWPQGPSSSQPESSQPQTLLEQAQELINPIMEKHGKR
jgi:hypothetical protein